MKKNFVLLGLLGAMYSAQATVTKSGTVSEYEEHRNGTTITISFRCLPSTDWCYTRDGSSLWVNPCRIIPTSQDPVYDPNTDRYTIEYEE